MGFLSFEMLNVCTRLREGEKQITEVVRIA
jgi:hypothetical protein